MSCVISVLPFLKSLFSKPFFLMFQCPLFPSQVHRLYPLQDVPHHAGRVWRVREHHPLCPHRLPAHAGGHRAVQRAPAEPATHQVLQEGPLAEDRKHACNAHHMMADVGRLLGSAFLFLCTSLRTEKGCRKTLLFF